MRFHRQIGPGHRVEAFDRLAGKACLKQMHMRIGAKRQSRRIILLEPRHRMFAMGFNPRAQRIAALDHLCLAARENLRQIGKGQEGEGLIVEIEGWIDKIAIRIRQRAIKAAWLQVDAVEIGKPMGCGRLPIAGPSAPPGLCKAIDLTRLDARAPVGPRRLPRHVDRLDKAAAGAVKALVAPKRQRLVGKPIVQFFGKPGNIH